MFDRENNLINPQGIDSYQNGERDPKTEALALVQDAYLELGLTDTHPWYASDADSLRVALAGVAYVQDRTAELLRENGAVTSRRNDVFVTPDVAAFAGELSQTSIQRIDLARQINPHDSSVLLSVDEVLQLQAENMMPYWPNYPDQASYAAETWQCNPQFGEHIEVSDGFIKGILESAREIEAYAYHGLNKLAGPDATNLPDEYSAMTQDIESNFFAPYSARLAEVYSALGDIGQLGAAQKAALYQTAHDCFIAMMRAYVAVLAPVTLGEDFRPLERPQL